MSNEIYASTGTFIGRANGCEPDVIKREAPNIKCDGFELMLLSAWYDDFFKIIPLFVRGVTYRFIFSNF